MQNKIVFDIDDTICDNKGRDYPNAIPYIDVIDKINKLHEQGFYIVLYTSRGMVSCNGDISKIVAKNKEVLEEWLNRYDVQYDELIFGKPIADLYVDDKAMSLCDFKSAIFTPLKGGGSGSTIYRLGNVVKKELKEGEVQKIKSWYHDNCSICKAPQVICFTYNSMYMEYVPGEILSKVKIGVEEVNNLYNMIRKFSKYKYADFDISQPISVIEKNRVDEIISPYVDLCINKLNEYAEILKANASFSHGDCILSNMIRNENEICLLDPQYYEYSSSYLLDLAKLNMSILGYEYNFGLSDLKPNKMSIEYYHYLLNKNNIYNVVTILTLMYIVRLYRYKDEKQKQIVIDMAKGVIAENEELFSTN